MERIARMSRMHASRVFFVRSFGSTEQKNKTNKKKKFFFGLARKRERNASWKRDQNLNETRGSTTPQETDINIFKLFPDDD